MTFEQKLHALLSTLAPGAVYRMVTPDSGGILDPFIVYQQISGQARWYLDQTLPQHKHHRIQISCWGGSSKTVLALANAVESAIAAADWPAQPYDNHTDLYIPESKLYGTRQQFGIWHPAPL